MEERERKKKILLSVWDPTDHTIETIIFQKAPFPEFHQFLLKSAKANKAHGAGTPERHRGAPPAPTIGIYLMLAST